jgi:hypothetical protein
MVQLVVEVEVAAAAGLGHVGASGTSLGAHCVGPYRNPHFVAWQPAAELIRARSEYVV